MAPLAGLNGNAVQDSHGQGHSQVKDQRDALTLEAALLALLEAALLAVLAATLALKALLFAATLAFEPLLLPLEPLLLPLEPLLLLWNSTTCRQSTLAIIPPHSGTTSCTAARFSLCRGSSVMSARPAGPAHDDAPWLLELPPLYVHLRLRQRSMSNGLHRHEQHL